MRYGNDCAPRTSAFLEGLKQRLKSTTLHETDAVSDFRQGFACPAVTLRGLATTALAGGLVVAGAQTEPGGEVCCIGEALLLIGELAEQEPCGELFDAGNGHQAVDVLLIGRLHALQQRDLRIASRNQILQVLIGASQELTQCIRHGEVDGLKDFLLRGAELFARGADDLLKVPIAPDIGVKNLPGGFAVHVAENGGGSTADGVEILVVAVLLTADVVAQPDDVAGNHPHVAERAAWNEGFVELPQPGVLSEAFGILSVRFAADSRLDVPMR